MSSARSSTIDAGNRLTTAMDAIVLGPGYAGLRKLHMLRYRLRLKLKVPKARDDVCGTSSCKCYSGARSEAEWETCGLRFRAGVADLLISKEANKTAAEFIRDRSRNIFVDPIMAKKRTPNDQPSAIKRRRSTTILSGLQPRQRRVV
jgi:hypothetical protein